MMGGHPTQGGRLPCSTLRYVGQAHTDRNPAAAIESEHE
ncbi:hypothetical protein SCOR_30705 [Sulfidibacter corallicola]